MDNKIIFSMVRVSKIHKPNKTVLKVTPLFPKPPATS